MGVSVNFSLTPALEKFVKDCANSGDYNNASEVVREALRHLKQRRENDAMKLERLRQEIKKGHDSIDRGDYVEVKDDKELEEFFAKL